MLMSSRKRARNDSSSVIVAESDCPSKEKLHIILDEYCHTRGLVELHSHLMGMGSADFWVSRIIEQYIPRSLATRGAKDVFYPLKDIMIASSIMKPQSGDDEWDKSIMLATLESRLFDGIRGGSFAKYCKTKTIKNKKVYGIYNNDLVALLNQEEAENRNGRPLRALVRNWFEFLDSGGNAASHTDILDSYRGKFEPEFYPRRFIIKDCIVATHPEVLSILLNSVTHRYGKAGVGYMELSVSVGDLTKTEMLKYLWDDVHSGTKSSATSKPRNSNKLRGTSTPEPISVAQRSVITDASSTSSTPTLKQVSSTQKVQIHGSDRVCFHEDEGYATPTKETPTVASDMTASQSTPQIPHMPKASELRYLRPTWRRYINYYDKADKQKYYFLGALNRNAVVKLPVAAIANSEGVGIRCEQLPPEHSSTAAYHMLYKLGKSCLNAELESCSRQYICERFSHLAEQLCRDDVICEIFFNSEGNSYRKKLNALNEQCSSLIQFMVGLDWVGNEIGYPYCIYTHDDCINTIAKYQKLNPRFGVRLHAGEGLLRPATNEDHRSPVSIAFTLHMYILTASIWCYYEKMEAALVGTGLKPNIRIGHGVAFLHGHDIMNPEDPLHEHLANFRQFLRDKDIVCELNPTSNHLLLSDSCSETTLSNNRTLKAFLKEKMSVTLCTDDDGIWAIHKCPKHYHHISVAYEYCQAIEHGDVTNEVDLRNMLDAGRKYAFCSE